MLLLNRIRQRWNRRPQPSPSLLVYSAQMEAMGGIEAHVVEFCLRLAAHGYCITLLCSRYALHAEAEARLSAGGIELRVNRADLAIRSAAYKFLWTLMQLLSLLRRRFAAVYTNGQGRNPALVQAWYRGRTRCVHHHHTACDDLDIATWPASYRAAMRGADALVVCADYIRPRMQRALRRAEVEAIYCFSRPVTASARRPTSDCLTFGYYGRLIREKGIEYIFRLSHDPRLAGIRWCVWGAGSNYSAGDFAPHPNVHYAGSFSNEAGLRHALESLDCFCLFSTHPEGLPVALLEVMSAGLPWIATAQGGIPELVREPASCVLVDLHDYEGVVSACVAMKERINAGALDPARQSGFYDERFAPPRLLRRWVDLLIGLSPATKAQYKQSLAQR
jgi:glycosyltransferase involved in cell wall biosynthesis